VKERFIEERRKKEYLVIDVKKEGIQKGVARQVSNMYPVGVKWQLSMALPSF
jgi:hypothetical protein